VYESLAGDYLAFLYAPPWAVIFAVLMLLPLAAALLVGQVLGLRCVMGSWIGVGLMGWLPIVADELSIGNVDFIMAAVILAGASQKRWSGPAIALFAFAKLSPVLVLSRSTLRGAALGAALLVALTLPWWHLWPEWIGMLSQSRDSSLLAVPLLPRIPIAFGLLAIRRPWAVAAAAAMATPALYFHSVLLFLPAIRLMVANRASARAIFLRRFGHSSDFVQTTPDAALP
jgi:hypothetical protein